MVHRPMLALPGIVAGVADGVKRPLGFGEIEDLLAMGLVARYLSIAPTASPRRGAHVLRARTG